MLNRFLIEIVLLCAVSIGFWNFMEARRWRAEHQFRVYDRFEFGRFLRSPAFKKLTRESVERTKQQSLTLERAMLVYIVTVNDCGQPLMELAELVQRLDEENIDIGVVMIGATSQEVSQLAPGFPVEEMQSRRIHFVADESGSTQDLGLPQAPYRFLAWLQPARVLDEGMVQFQPEQVPHLAARLNAKARLLRSTVR